jgi:hypothetical protein
MTAIKNKKRTLVLVVVFLFFVAVFFASMRVALAEEGFGNMSGYLDSIAHDVNLGQNKTSVPVMIGQILFGVLGFLGVVCLLLVIYAGLKWMLADGNEETVSESKKIILYAIIGMLVIMGSYAVTYYVVDRIVGSTLSGNTPNIKIPEGNHGIGDAPGYIECFVPADCSCPNDEQTALCDVQTNTCYCDQKCDNVACSDQCKLSGGGVCQPSGECRCHDWTD